VDDDDEARRRGRSRRIEAARALLAERALVDRQSHGSLHGRTTLRALERLHRRRQRIVFPEGLPSVTAARWQARDAQTARETVHLRVSWGPKARGRARRHASATRCRRSLARDRSTPPERGAERRANHAGTGAREPRHRPCGSLGMARQGLTMRPGPRRRPVAARQRLAGLVDERRRDREATAARSCAGRPRRV
jgi:hypothetical protein